MCYVGQVQEVNTFLAEKQDLLFINCRLMVIFNSSIKFLISPSEVEILKEQFRSVLRMNIIGCLKLLRYC